jgi:HAMP domain-containing protein
MNKSKVSISSKFTALLVVIIALNGYAYYLILQNIYLQELKAQAQTVVGNVDAFGTWVAQGGRVWVKGKSSDSFLSQESFAQTDDSQERVHFFSKNPALAQREFSEVVAKSNSPAKFRMTSQNVMNPVNAPDAFEVIALSKVGVAGTLEYADFVGGDYRYAKAVYHNESCIACHGDPNKAPADVISRYGSEHGFGFKTGDLAGVISVTIPARKLYQSIWSFIGVKEIALILTSIVLALWFVRSALIAPIKRLTEAAHDISTGKDTLIDIQGIDLNTKNELHQLTLAISRMKSSTTIAIKKMREAKTAAVDILAKAKVAVAKAREDAQDK